VSTGEGLLGNQMKESASKKESSAGWQGLRRIFVFQEKMKRGLSANAAAAHVRAQQFFGGKQGQHQACKAGKRAAHLNQFHDGASFISCSVSHC
jgi:hypothetical protein